MNALGSRSAPVTVLGAGHWGIATDRSGPQVVERLRHRYGDEVEVEHLGVRALGLLDHLHGQELLCLVDACLLGGAPGQVYVTELHGDEATGAVGSLHQIGPLETLAIAARLYPEALPKRALLIGIETGGIDERTEALACDAAVAALDREIDRWRSGR